MTAAIFIGSRLVEHAGFRTELPKRESTAPDKRPRARQGQEKGKQHKDW